MIHLPLDVTDPIALWAVPWCRRAVTGRRVSGSLGRSLTWSIVDELMWTAPVAMMRGRSAMTEFFWSTAFIVPGGVARAAMRRPPCE